MKLLCTADVHIRNYSKFTKWNSIIPERLEVYLDLAEDIVNIASNQKVDSFIIAGDLLDIAVSPPMVLNVVDEFLGKLSSYSNVYLTHGQHDISTKTVDEYLKQLTSLSIFESDKVKLFHNEVVPIDGISIFFYGWSHDDPDFLDADMFVSHGLVRGSNNILNYTFQMGYDAEFLSNKYKFSIIGDIHKSQIFHGNVLIPGPPIQNSFKDSPRNGVWILDTDSWSCDFFEISGRRYPKFFYVNSKEDIPQERSEYHHYQVASIGRQKEVSETIQSSNISLDLWNIIESLILSLKTDKDIKDLLSLAKSIYDDGISSESKTRHIPQINLSRISIQNFFSIKSFSFEFPETTVSISGEIGSGKSTLLDAICYGLYGVTTKGKFKDDMIPVSYKPTGDTQVTLEFFIGDSVYKINRSTNSLKFEINGSEVTGSRIADTQVMIEEVLQISLSEFQCLVYFSQESGSFFGSLTNSQQMSLMTMFLSQQDYYVEKMVSSVGLSCKRYMNEVLKIEGSITNLQVLNQKNIERLNELKSYQVSLRDRQIESLKFSKYSDADITIIDLLIQNKVIDAINQYFGIDFEKTKEKLTLLKDKKSSMLSDRFNSEIEISKIESQIISTRNDLNRLVKKLKSYKSGVCSECNQPLPIESDVLESMVSQVTQYKIEIKKLEDSLIPQSEKLKRILSQLPVLDSKISDIDQIVSDCNSFKSKRQSEVSVDQVEIDILSKSVTDFETQRQELEKQKFEFQNLFELYEILTKKVFNDKGIKAKCVEYIGKFLSDEVNSLLESIDSDLRVTINTVTYNKSGGLSTGFDVTANFNGVEIKYRNASGGQKMLIDISSVVSIYNLLSSIYNLPFGLLSFVAMDESVKYLDSKNIDTVRDIINCLRAKTVFIVSHDEKLSQLLSDRSIFVSMKDGVSHYELL